MVDYGLPGLPHEEMYRNGVVYKFKTGVHHIEVDLID
jgi:hypothetical protein